MLIYRTIPLTRLGKSTKSDASANIGRKKWKVFQDCIHKSYIRKEKYHPTTTTPTVTTTAVSRSGDPPWILKQVGPGSSGQRLIS